MSARLDFIVSWRRARKIDGVSVSKELFLDVFWGTLLVVTDVRLHARILLSVGVEREK